jgi:hypothetical protein
MEGMNFYDDKKKLKEENDPVTNNGGQVFNYQDDDNDQGENLKTGRPPLLVLYSKEATLTKELCERIDIDEEIQQLSPAAWNQICAPSNANAKTYTDEVKTKGHFYEGDDDLIIRWDAVAANFVLDVRTVCIEPDVDVFLRYRGEGSEITEKAPEAIKVDHSRSGGGQVKYFLGCQRPTARQQQVAREMADTIIRAVAYASEWMEFSTKFLPKYYVPSHTEYVPLDSTPKAAVDAVTLPGARGKLSEDGFGHWAIAQHNKSIFWRAAPIPAGMKSFLDDTGREVYAAADARKEEENAVNNVPARVKYLAFDDAAIQTGIIARGDEEAPLRDARLEEVNTYVPRETANVRLPILYGDNTPIGRKWEENKEATLRYRPSAIDNNAVVADDGVYGDYDYSVGYGADYGYGDYADDYAYGMDYGYGADYAYGDYAYDYDY